MLRRHIIATVFFKELRELMRDRRSLMVMFGVPLVVYPLLFAGIGALAKGKAQQQREQKLKIVLENGQAAPELARRLALPEYRIELVPGPATDQKLQQGELNAVLSVPDNFEPALLGPVPPSTAPTTSPDSTNESTGPPAKQSPTATSGPTTAPADQGPKLVIRVDRSRGESEATESRLRSVIQAYERWVLEQRLKERNVPPEVLTPITRTTVDIATRDQRLGKFLAQLLPLLLLVTGMLGAFFPALSATTTERELGTLETLLVSPVGRTELLLAKSLLVLGCSILTAGLNMISMSLVFTRIASQAGAEFGEVSINLSAILLAFVAALPALVLFSAIVMCVGMIARTYREANSFAAPVMMLPLAAMAIGMADPASTPGLMATPIANTTLIIRDILTSRVTVQNFAIAAGSNLLFAGIVLSIAARLFSNEQLVNPSWEPLSLKGFRRGKGPRKPRWPTVDEALLLIAAAVLIQFYAGPSLLKLVSNERGEFSIPLLITLIQAASMLLPVAVLTLLARYPARDVLRLTPPSSPLSIPAALLLGIGLSLVGVYYQVVQHHFTGVQPSDSSQGVAELIGKSLQTSLLMSVLVFGLVPGICEELLFRGVVLSAFRKRTNIHIAVWATAVLFGLVHMDFAGLVTRTLLGAVLGYVALATGSILAPILLHAAYNGTQVVLLARLSASDSATRPVIADEALNPFSGQWLARLAIGVIITAVAATLLRATRKPQPA